MIRKAMSGVTVKDATKGELTAVFATLNVKDKDGDVTLPGAFTEGAQVVVSAYGHKSWEGALPLGRGTIHEEGDLAIADVKFFMDTTHGADAFKTLAGLGELGEWSYSLHDVVAEKGMHKGEKVQFIKSVRVKEVSPVLVGAGVDTMTTSAKAFIEAAHLMLDDESQDEVASKFSEVRDSTLRGIKSAGQRLTQRAAEGKSIAEQIEFIADLKSAVAELESLVLTQEPPFDEYAAQLAAVLAALHHV